MRALPSLRPGVIVRCRLWMSARVHDGCHVVSQVRSAAPKSSRAKSGGSGDHRFSFFALPNLAISRIKAAPAAPLARRQRWAQRWGRPPTARRAAPCRARRSRRLNDTWPLQRAAVFLAPDCPARGHRVKGAPPGRRFAQTLDPASTRKDLAPARNWSSLGVSRPTRCGYQ
jgi:hypothetical protein